MTFDYDQLDVSFVLLAKQLFQAMTDLGYKITPYYGLRTLESSAIFWRQSRNADVVHKQIKAYRDADCDFLADVLENVGPHSGPWRSNALPGQSYHNYGLAMDCLIKDGTDADYKVYADTAIGIGLTAGYYFKSVDMGHVQLGASHVPFDYTMQDINHYFKF